MQYGAINIDPETMGGTPVFSGTRVPIQALFDFLEADKPVEDFLGNFPMVSRQQVIEVLEKAKLTMTTEKILNENFT